MKADVPLFQDLWKRPDLKPRDPDDGTLLMTPEDTKYAPLVLDAEYVAKHKPQAGGYFVVYADGYRSWSPAKAFEDGYARC